MAALQSRCRLWLGNDTGLTHLAAAVGTPVVATFGPTCPELYLPRSSPALPAGGEGVACPHRHPESLSPPDCWHVGRCLLGERSCIDRVSVDEVHARVERLLRVDEDTPDRRHILKEARVSLPGDRDSRGSTPLSILGAVAP